MSEIKVLFIGDIVGKAARKAVKKYLPNLIKEHDPDLIIANGENLAHGKGVTKKTIQEMADLGVNFFTSGNHVFDNKKAVPDLKDLPLVVPANYPESVPGKKYEILKVGKSKVAILNLLGRVFTNSYVDCPFRTADNFIREIKKKKVTIIIVDIHAEASAEKVAMKYYLDGKISALLGTHTHIQTADAQISQKGTAYMTDVGAVYLEDSVIGVSKEIVIKKFLTDLPLTHEIPDKGTCIFNAVLITLDSKTGKAKDILPIYEIVKTKN